MIIRTSYPKEIIATLIPNYYEFKFIYFLPEKIVTSNNSADDFYLMPNYCSEEFKYISKIIKGANTKYCLFVEIKKNILLNIDYKNLPLKSKKYNFYHFSFFIKPLFSNIKFCDNVKSNNFFIFGDKHTMFKVFNSPKMSIENISVLPKFIKESKNCKLDTLFISFLRNQFNPIISYNDLMVNLKKIKSEIFSNIS